MTAVINEINWTKYRELVPIGYDPKPNSGAAYMRDEIIVSHMYLIKRIVSKMLKSMPTHVERDDLESWRAIGLMQAVQRYNPDYYKDSNKIVPFEAYATQRMRSVIMDGIREQDWAPRSLRRQQRQIDKTERELEQELGRAPTLQETASTLGLSNIEVSQTKHKSENSSHTYIEGCTEALNKFDTDPEELDLASNIRKNIAETLIKMPIKQATIIALHYYDEKKLSEVAQLMGMSEVKVGQLHKEAVLNLWRGLEEVLKEE